MPQIFTPASNTVSRVSAVGAFVLVFALLWLAARFQRSSYATHKENARSQPIPFSHAHHVGGLGIDCRYCHGSVEDSAFAGIPPTATCMSCHRQIWTDSPMLEPVRASYRTGTPIRWIRVHDLPDFVYFDHSIHVKKGIGCSSCHGQVDRMPLLWQEATLHMEWCLACHRNPERHIRPRERVFDMSFQPAEDQEARGRELVRRYDVHRLESCSYCHR